MSWLVDSATSRSFWTRPENLFSNSQTDWNPLLKYLAPTFQLPPTHDDLHLSLLFHPLPQLDGGVQLQGPKLTRNGLLLLTLFFPNPQENYPIHRLPCSEGGMCSATHLIQTPWLFTDNNPETFPNLMGSLPTTLQIQPSAQQFRRLARWPIMKPKNWQLADPYLIWTEMYNSGEPRAAPPWSSSN